MRRIITGALLGLGLGACAAGEAELACLKAGGDAECLTDRPEVAASERGLFFTADGAPWFDDDVIRYRPPRACDHGAFLRGLYCHNTRCGAAVLECIATRFDQGRRYWTPYFSEEGSATGMCASRYFVTGLKCRGPDCDEWTLECSYPLDARQGRCEWSGWFGTNEWSPLPPEGSFIRGMQCRGSRCERLSIYHCTLEDA